MALLFSALLLTGALLTAARSHGYLELLELAAYDLLVATLSPAREDRSEVTLVIIGEGDIRALGNWPLTDEQMSRILRRLLELGPTVVGLDIYRDLPVPPGTGSLEELLRTEQRIVVIERLPGPDSQGVAAPPALRGSTRVGFADLVTDPGGVIRRNLLFQSHDEDVSYSLSLRLALAHLATLGVFPRPAPDDPSLLRLGESTLQPLSGDEGGYAGADAGGYQIMLDYAGSGDPFPAYGLAAVLDETLEPDDVRGRIVILGVASASVKDTFPTPFSILGTGAGTMPGVAVHAHAAQQLLDIALGRQQPLRAWSEPLETAWIWGWTAAGLIVGWFAASAWRLAAVMAAGVVAAGLLGGYAYVLGWWIPVVPNLAGWLLAVALGTAIVASRRRQEQRVLMGLFARHVAPQVADDIWRHRGEVLEGGRVRPRMLTATTLFADLQGFTSVSDRSDPVELLDWLNSYLGTLTEAIMELGGVLDDFAGDGIKANFGVPLHDPDKIADDARNAVRCAMAMAARLERMNEEWVHRGGVRVGMRIGIHTGLVVAGTVGSRARMKYTTIGREVNRAARLEALGAVAGPDAQDAAQSCRILISDATAELVGDVFKLEDLGCFQLKGIAASTRVFRVLCAETGEGGARPQNL